MQKVIMPLIGFIEFIREQGVIGLSIGFVIGASVAQVVNALVKDIIDPIVSLILGSSGNIQDATFTVNGVTFMYGHFLSVLLNFIIVLAVVYFVFKGLKFEKLDKKKEDKK